MLLSPRDQTGTLHIPPTLTMTTISLGFTHHLTKGLSLVIASPPCPMSTSTTC